MPSEARLYVIARKLLAGAAVLASLIALVALVDTVIGVGLSGSWPAVVFMLFAAVVAFGGYLYCGRLIRVEDRGGKPPV